MTTAASFYDASSPLSDDTGIFTRLRRRKGTFAITFVVVIGVVAGVYLLIPRVYSGAASVILASPDPVVGDAGSPASEQKLGDPADIESQSLVIASGRLLEGVVSDPRIIDLMQRGCEQGRNLIARIVQGVTGGEDACAKLGRDREAALNYLQEKLDISQSGRSRVINVGLRSPLPEAAQEIPNAVVRAYVNDARQQKLESREAAVTWLRTEVQRLSTELHGEEGSIEAYRRGHGLVRGQMADFSSEQLTQLGQQLAAAEAQRAEAAAKLAQLGGGSGDASEMRDTLESRTIENLKQQIASIDAQTADFSSRYGTSYPGLVGLREQRRATMQRLSDETRRVGGSLQRDLAAASARVAQLLQQMQAAKEQVSVGTAAETEIASIQRDADIKRELYVDLSKKVNALETERRVLTGNAQVVDFADLPTKIAFPRKLPFILVGAMLATALASGAGLMRDRSDSTVRAGRNVQALAGVPVLGFIPQHRRRLKGSRLTAAIEVSRPSALQEAVRALYAQCVLVRGPERPRTLMVTSALPGDGKTFTTLALARFAAASGKRVLAIEGDLRRPDFAAALGLPARNGLSEFLRGGLPQEQVIHPSGVGGLDIIPAGRPAIDSTELLSSGAMVQLLVWAAAHYDLVIIDSPPTCALMDAHLLARSVDAVLYCARWGRSEIVSVSEGVKEINDAGGKVIGLAIDMVDQAQYRLYDTRSSYAATWELAPVA